MQRAWRGVVLALSLRPSSTSRVQHDVFRESLTAVNLSFISSEPTRQIRFFSNTHAKILKRHLPTSHQMASNESSDSSQWKLEEKTGDLFQCPADHSLAHCVSRDLHMGKGIAVIFRDKFSRVNELRKQEKKTGEVAVLKVGSRYVYYLVTKEKYSYKPTYDSLQRSLEAMREHCLQNAVLHLAMPRIGCGLDGLKYDRVKQILEEVFGNTPIAITIYSL